MKRVWMGVGIAALMMSACFLGGKEPRSSIRGYRDGIVTLKEGQYQIGTLPAAWQMTPFKYKTLLFHNAALSASIATYALCGEHYDDASLEVLSRHLYMGLQEVTVVSQEEEMLAGRRSLWTLWHGRLDGVPVALETVSIQKDECLFDFYYVSSPETFNAGESDFKRMVEGFSYP